MKRTKMSKSGCYKQALLEYHARLSRQPPSAERVHMLKINNRKLEDQIKEILQCTRYAFAEEYLIARVTSDHLAVRRGEKLP